MVPPQVAAIIKERGLFHAEEGEGNALQVCSEQ